MATLKEEQASYNTNAAINTAAQWKSTTFTASSTYYVGQVSVVLFKTGDVGDFTLSIKAVDGGTGKPTGADLVSKVVATASIPTVTPDWVDFTFDTSYELTSGTKYAIVIRTASVGGGSQGQYWVQNGNPYANGQLWQSTDSGATWGDYSAYDGSFRVYVTTTPVDITGSATAASSDSGSITVNTIVLITGSSTGASSVGGVLDLELVVSPNWQTTTFAGATKRLVVIGNDALYYEAI